MEIDRLGNSKRVRAIVIVDTNFLIMMAKGLIAPSMVSEVLEISYAFISPVAIKIELKRLAEKSPKSSMRRLAEKALEIAEKIGVEFLDGKYASMKADDAVQALALDLKSSRKYVLVATSDRELRRRLRILGIPSIYYRESEARLEIETDII